MTKLRVALALTVLALGSASLGACANCNRSAQKSCAGKDCSGATCEPGEKCAKSSCGGCPGAGASSCSKK